MSNSDNSKGHVKSKLFGRTTVYDQRVISHNQSGGITAHTVNLGPQPRRMDQTLKSQILRDLPKTDPITVMAMWGDGESIQLASEIHAFLKANGFPLTEDGISQGVFTEPAKGLGFNPATSTFIVGTNLP